MTAEHAIDPADMDRLLPVLRGSAAESFAYYGEREGWRIALQHNRDSDALARSNWAVISEDLIGRYPRAVAVESMSHWAVGWVEYLLIDPTAEDALQAALAWRARLDSYPVADEEAFGLLEWEEAWCVRCDLGTRAQHGNGDGWARIGDCPFRSEDDAEEIRYRWDARKDGRSARVPETAEATAARWMARWSTDGTVAR